MNVQYTAPMANQRFHVNERIEEASTLPSKFYKEESVFHAVREQIFAKSWQFALDTDAVKVPGAVMPMTLLEGFLDEPIVAVRDTQDKLHVHSNVCTHRGMQVVEGAGNERFLRCRYHGRRFGLDGRFQHMPEFEGVCGFPSERDHLPSIPFGTWGKFIFCSLFPEVSVDQWLGPMKNRLSWLPIDQGVYDPSRARDYLINANWALYIDNYLEGFHIPFIHASLNDVLDYDQYEYEHYPFGNLQLGISKGGEGTFNLPINSPDYGRSVSAYYYWLFPNTMFNIYPWGISINIVRPISPNLTKVSFLPYVWDASKIGAGAGAALDRVEREDEAVVELVQRGVRSRLYDTGRYSPKQESNVHQFHQLLAARLTSEH
jgi:choline monooxygenase